MESVTRTRSQTANAERSVLGGRPNGFHEKPAILREAGAPHREVSISTPLQRWSIQALRVALGLVFLWFGALKVLGMSPITPMLRETNHFLALPVFSILLGLWEILIGLGLLFKIALRQTLWLMCVHLSGTFIVFFLAPSLFFIHGNPLLLTVNGEFVMKNLVLLTGGLVVIANDSFFFSRRRTRVRTRLSETSAEAFTQRGSGRAGLGLGQN